MAPEFQVLAINAAALAVAYLGIFPALRPLTLSRLALADLGVGSAAMATSGALYWDSGVTFWLLGFQANWFVFALLTLMAMEAPLLRWFMRRNGIGFGPNA
jgi:hypothetical protein